jgi:drug/metabolite transporter (DMT)-like permease
LDKTRYYAEMAFPGTDTLDTNSLLARRKLAGQGAILLCAVLWSTSGLLIKLVDWNPILIAGSRSLIAALFIFTLRVIRVKLRGAPLPSSKFSIVILGSVMYAATMLTFVGANKLTFSANAILLQYTSPIWAALLGWLLIKEKARWFHWVALVFVMGGLVIFFREGLKGGSLIGDSLALVSGFFYGTHSVVMRMQKDGTPSDSMLGAHIICVLIAIPFFFFYPPVLKVSAIQAIVFMGFIQIGLTSQLFSFGIRRVSAMQAMITAMIEPVLNPVWVFLVTRELPSGTALLGGAIIVLAVLFSSVAATLDLQGNARKFKL